MNPKATISVSFCAASAAAVLVAAGLLLFVQAASAAGEAADANAAPPAPAGQKVNIDPQTGRFLETPALPAPVRRASALAPVVLEPSPVPGGGVGFQVPDNRFDSEMKVSSGPDAKPKIGCETPAK